MEIKIINLLMSGFKIILKIMDFEYENDGWKMRTQADPTSLEIPLDISK